ncbi:MAG: GNAT family N-acetyltransferase [Bacillota bacterium]
MKEFEGLTFLSMTEAHVPVLTPIMKRAFDDDSRLFFQKPAGGPPGYDDGSFLRKWGLHENAEAYRIDKDGRPIGALILFIDERLQVGHLGCLFIDPDLIGQAIGTTVWRFVEHSHPLIKVWTTETPAVSYRNHRFYINRCGFHVTAVVGDQDRFQAQFKLRKEIK